MSQLGFLRRLLILPFGLCLTLLLGCGPEGRSIDVRNAEKRSNNNKLRQELSPIAGYYRGELVTASKKVLLIEADIRVYSFIEEGGEAGEETATPMLQTYIAEYNPETAEKGIVLGVFNRSSYNAQTGQLMLFNPQNEFGARTGVEGRFFPATPESPAQIKGQLNNPLGFNQISLTKVRD